MTQYKEKLKHYYKLMYFLLFCAGFAGEQSDNIIKRNRILLIIFCLYAVLVTSCTIHDGYPDNLEEIVYAIAPLGASVNALFKLCIYLKYQQELKTLINIIQDEFWDEKSKSSEEERNVILKYARFAHLCIILDNVVAFTASLFYIILPLGEMALNRIKNPTEELKRLLPFKTWWPNNFDVYAEPLYEVELILQTLTTLSVSFLLQLTTCIFIHIVLNTCGQFKLIQVRLENFITSYNGTKSDMNSQKLHRIIEHHQYLLNLCAKMETCFTFPLFSECMVDSLFLCFVEFSTIMIPSPFIYVMSFLGICACVFELLSHSLPPTMLTTQSLNVAQAAYNSNWQDMDVEIQKQIIFIIARAQKPIYLTAGKLTPMSVETFEKIMRSSASYFCMLKSFQNSE